MPHPIGQCGGRRVQGAREEHGGAPFGDHGQAVILVADRVLDPLGNATAVTPPDGMSCGEGHIVAGWIRERGLEQWRRDLADPRPAARPIHAIAGRCAFTNPVHFGQAFRCSYGLSLRQYRQQ